jgi:diguanylate cyclase (GGDEF)-like protein/PAS domain S-box-containing protein
MNNNSFDALPMLSKLRQLRVVTLGIAMLFILTATAATTIWQEKDNLHVDSESLGSVIASNAVAALMFNDNVAGSEILKSLRGRQNVLAAQLYKQNGDLFADYTAQDTSFTKTADQESEWSSLVLTQPITQKSDTVGTLRLTIDLHPMWWNVSWRIFQVLVVMMAAYLISSVYGHRMAKRIVEPIKKLSDLTKEVSHNQNYQLRASGEGDDEIGELVRSFNHMINQVHQRNTVLLDYQNGLEQEIEQRCSIEKQLRVMSVAFETQESVMITDTDGVILRVNNAFIQSTGYTAEEAIGKTPRLLRSGRHDADFYREMWQSIHRIGKWEGEVWDRRKNGEEFPKWLTISAVKGDDGITTHYVGTHIDITQRKLAEEEINNLAFYDTLTNLPNRRLLLDRLQHALATSARVGRKGAVLFIDLDNFKTLNDTLGHDKGDLLLQQVAQRLTSCVRKSDTVARLGGDEFVVILEDLSVQYLDAGAQTEAFGAKILLALNQPYQLAAHEYRSTPSIGATLFNGQDQGIEELLKQADIAMYESKKAGRNAIRFFDVEMQNVISTRATLEGELHKALENRQFHLHYQIQVDSSHRPIGAEALIRWIHPERGLVSPDQFIPLAEETGLILSIGQWVLEAACAQLKSWEQDSDTRGLVLAVNVSANQFRQAGFALKVKKIIENHVINPIMLKLELTESLLVDDIEGTIATMNTLRKIGVQFSLDDFGTGYSSLQYLKRLPLTQLKIDQSFVRDIAVDSSDKAIVSTIIAMAHSLKLDVIAEGVETEDQRQFLLDSGCTHYQGDLFSKPVPIDQFEALLKRD